MAKQSIWVLGNHAVDAVLNLSPERAVGVWVCINPSNATQRSLLSQVERLGIPIYPVDKRALSKRTGSEQHQGIALEAKAKAALTERELDPFVNNLMQSKAPLLLILDQVQDPHNFGACLRTADAAGADAVIVAKDNASPMTPVVQKVASGAAETMPIFRVTNLVRAMESLKQLGVWMIGTSDKAPHSL
jgi:23S rRNA (guanosine2251-2'-O)-methyltransferase